MQNLFSVRLRIMPTQVRVNCRTSQFQFRISGTDTCALPVFAGLPCFSYPCPKSYDNNIIQAETAALCRWMQDHIVLLLLIATGFTSPFPLAQCANASLKSEPASLLAHLRRGTLLSHRRRRGLTLLFLSLSHRHPGSAAALRRPVQHLHLCIPAERKLPHQRTQELGVAQQRPAADRDPEEGKEEPARN